MQKKIVIFDGREYGLTELITTLNISKTSFYRYKKNGYNNIEAIEKCLNNEREHYTFNGEVCSISAIAKRFKINRVTIYKYLKEGYKLEEAVPIILESKKMKYDPAKKKKVDITYYLYNGENLTLQQISKKEQISSSNLYRHVIIEKEDVCIAVSKIKKNQKKKVHSSKFVQQEVRFFQKDGMTLAKYCLVHGYNYQAIIDKLLKSKSTVDEVLKDYLTNGQDTRQTWKYQHGKVITKHLLTKYGLNSNYAFYLMKKNNKTLEEIIPKLVFSKQNTEYNKNEGLYLYQVYCILEKQTLDERREFLKLQSLSSKQQSIMEEKHREISFIKRELLYYELEPILEVCSADEKNRLITFYSITEEELDYIHNRLYDGFSLMGNSQHKGYYKMPETFDKKRK